MDAIEPRRYRNYETDTWSGLYSKDLRKNDKWKPHSDHQHPAGTGDDGFKNDVKDLADELVNLLVRKQSDYGPLSISQTPGGALKGIIVRMHDKVYLVFKKKTQKNESVIDTFLDIAGYAFLAILFLRGKWDKYEKNSHNL